MAMLEKIADMLDVQNREILHNNCEAITELRLRIEQPLRVDLLDGREVEGAAVEAKILHNILNHLMDNSLYSRENELKQGYFTAAGGVRVGVCGKVNSGRDGIEQLANIGSACIRIPREVQNCAEELFGHVLKAQRYSVLIVSPPGLGKTTFLRDYIRLLSDSGLNVGIADERRELACCMGGIPQLNVGCRTDVMDGCPKHLGLTMMIRSCAPNLVAADEIGSRSDGLAIMDARRCGVHVAASAHGYDLADAARRSAIGLLLERNVFDWCVLLGPGRGQVRQIIELHKAAEE